MKVRVHKARENMHKHYILSGDQNCVGGHEHNSAHILEQTVFDPSSNALNTLDVLCKQVRHTQLILSL